MSPSSQRAQCWCFLRTYYQHSIALAYVNPYAFSTWWGGEWKHWYELFEQQLITATWPLMSNHGALHTLVMCISSSFVHLRISGFIFRCYQLDGNQKRGTNNHFRCYYIRHWILYPRCGLDMIEVIETNDLQITTTTTKRVPSAPLEVGTIL